MLKVYRVTNDGSIIKLSKEYKDKAEFDADVADPNTDTTAADFQQDLIITPASIGGKSDTK